MTTLSTREWLVVALGSFLLAALCAASAVMHGDTPFGRDLLLLQLGFSLLQVAALRALWRRLFPRPPRPMTAAPGDRDG
jgi:cytochrome b561